MTADYQPGRIVSVQWTGTRKWDPAVVVKQDGLYVEVLVPGHQKPMTWNVKDVRPLVVLDLVNAEQTIKTLRIKANDCGIYQAGVLSELADQIEAQTKPKRIPEPGLWGVVEAAANGGAERGQFVHTPKFWYCAQLDQARGWDALTDPTLIREGVES